ncbi:transcriptional regulator [Bradyrhizobium sp. CCGE-LA001]|uniref:transcriptional regulator n=1 Tax=Bradyrhizobium sp. CCGE-LA001 TaxID=1223566 RepID=UPI00030DD0EC
MLAKAGYVSVGKAFVSKKSQTTVTATAAGRGAFAPCGDAAGLISSRHYASVEDMLVRSAAIPGDGHNLRGLPSVSALCPDPLGRFRKGVDAPEVSAGVWLGPENRLATSLWLAGCPCDRMILVPAFPVRC